MKKIIVLLAFGLIANVANAQYLEANTAAYAKANVESDQSIRTSGTLNASVNVKSDIELQENSEVEGNSSSTDDNTAEDGQNGSGDKGNSLDAGSAVSLEAKDIRGWNDEEKSVFLLSVKNHAELKSDQDLENFAKGVLISDQNVDSVVTDDSKVEVRYKLPAKFLGVFKSEIDASVNVSFDTEKNGNGPKEVTVKFPWYRMFFSLDSNTRSEILQNALEASIKSDISTSTASTTTNVSARNGQVIQIISNLLKGIRAEMESTTTVTVE